MNDKGSDREVITVHAQLKDKVKEAMVRREITINDKIEKECENIYRNLNRDLKETLSSAVKTVLLGMIKEMLTKPVGDLIKKHGNEVNNSFNVFQKRLNATVKNYEDIPDKCINSFVRLKEIWNKTFEEVNVITRNYIADTNTTKIFANDLGEWSNTMATEIMNVNKRFDDSHDNIKEDLKIQMASLQKIMQKLQITDNVTEVEIPQQAEVPAQAAFVEQVESLPDAVSLSMMQAGIIESAPAVLPVLSTGSDESLLQVFDKCEAELARK